MGDLDDQLRRLAEQRAARTSVTTSGDVFSSGPRRTNRFPVLIAAAATLAALAGLAIWLADDDTEDGTNVAGTTTTMTTATTTTAAATTTTTTAPDPTTPPVPPSSEPNPTVSYDLVVGTAAGIELRQTFTQDVDIISGPPTELAFLVDGWLVSQDAGRGPVRVRTGSITPTTDQLDLGEGRIRLQDAAILDGRATVLLTRRTGTTPEDTKERLLLVDLEDRSVTDLGVVGGWESGVDDARFADGAIALLKSAEGFTWIAALDYTGVELWATPETFDGIRSISVFVDTVSALDPAWNVDNTAPQFRVQRYELRSGERIEDFFYELTPVDGVALDEIYCQRLVLWPAPSCGQAVGAPVEIDFYSQTIAALPGALSAGTPTAVDAVVAREFPALPACEDDYFSVPEDNLLTETIVLPNGRLLTVIVFEQDDGLWVQAVGDGRPTASITLDLPLDRSDELWVAAESRPEGGGFTVSLSGQGVIVVFDGCELSAVG